MEKFNAIKILEEELEEKVLFDKNLSKEHYMKSVYSFVDTYIEPILKKKLDTLNLQAPQELIDEITEEITSDTTLTEEEKKTMLKIETINLFHNDRILHELLMQTTFVVNQLGLIIDKNSILYGDEVGTFLDDDDIGFLGKDKKTKEKVANKLCETIITMLKEEIDEETKKEC